MPKYLIIAGTNKAGTTSFFDYLADHPEVDASYIKQTFFFLDKELQRRLDLRAIYDYDNGLDQFGKYFKKNGKYKYRLEASPDYLYAPNTPQRLRNFFQKWPGKIIIILREPVSRFVSFFNFGKQQGLIPEGMGFRDFYYYAKNYQGDDNACLLAYKTGFYSDYVEHYVEIFGRENISFLFFEELKTDARKLMKLVSADLRIDPTFYDGYDFEIKNPTYKVKSQVLSKYYNNIRGWYIDNFYTNRIGVFIANILKRSVTPLYKKINFGQLKNKVIDLDVLQQLERDYQTERQKLAILTRREIPW